MAPQGFDPYNHRMAIFKTPHEISMTRRMFGRVALGAVFIALVLSLTSTWAQYTNAFGQIDLLVDIRHELMSYYVEEPDGEAMVEAAVRGMLDSLDDPYTSFLTAEELKEFEQYVHGSFTGIGAEVDIHEDRLRIVSPLEDSPAWKAGVMAGDVVLEIDGEDTEGMSITDAIKRLKGQADTDVTILVRHLTGDEAAITITCALIKVDTVRGIVRNEDQSHRFLLNSEQGLGYIRVTQFGDGTAEDFEAAVEQAIEQGAQALILDFRFNGGGLLGAAVSMADLFLDEGQRVVSVAGRAVPEKVYYASDSSTIDPSIPVVIIANEASASASEVFTGALSDNGRALFVGTRTFGKGSVQNVKYLEGEQGALKMTSAHYYLPLGRNIHRREGDETWGVDPSEGAYVPMTQDQIRDMIVARKESQIDHGGEVLRDITPEQAEDLLSDPQLAAAMRAAMGWLETGQWPSVGQDNADALVLAGRIEALASRRDRFREALDEIEKELAELEAQALDPDAAKQEAAAEEGESADAEVAESEADLEPALQP